MPHNPGFTTGIFLFVLDTLECPRFNFSGDQFASLTAKIGQKTENTVFIDQFQTVAKLLASPSPQIWAKFVIYYTPLSVSMLSRISQNFVLIAYTNQTLLRKTFWRGWAHSSLGIQEVYAY